MSTPTFLEQFSDQLASLAETSSPAVVQVMGRRTRPVTATVFAAERILVPAHGVDKDSGLLVGDGAGERRAAEWVGADAATGLAVLRVPGLPAKPLEPAAGPRPGELVLSLGRTWSGALAVSAGVVSVVGGPLRTGRGRSIAQVVRADVRVHPLGAGGPLVAAGGRAAGIATGAELRGLPLFVPAAIAWPIGEAISQHGSTRRGYLGVSAQPVRLPERLRGDRHQEVGLLVVATAPGSPAEEAGIIVGDLLVAFDGQAVEDHEALLSLLAGDRVGKPLPLEIVRGGEPRTVTVTVGERR